MTQKLTFVNGAKAACGCRHEFSSGGGEYSDVASVHLCAMHAGSPVLDDRWKARMLDGRAPERDEMGLGDHPELPRLDEGMMPRSFFAALGLELTHSMAEDQLDGDALEAMSEAVNWTGWTPTPPPGDGWKLVSIFDTEDGPAAWWLRELPEAEDGTTTIRNLQAEVEKLTARIARAGAAPAAVSPQADLDADLGRTVDQRDTAEGWADGLAGLIGKYFGRDIGEHSSAHCPWQEAKDIIEEAEPYHPATVTGPAWGEQQVHALAIHMAASAPPSHKPRDYDADMAWAHSALGFIAGHAPAAPALEAPAAPEQAAQVSRQPDYPEGHVLRNWAQGWNECAAYVERAALAAAPQAPAAPGSAITDAQVDAYLTTQRRSVEQADRLPMGITPTNAVREACRQGLLAAIGAAPAAPAVEAWLQPDDMAALQRFHETAEDDESYDIGKEAVARLCAFGCLQSHSFGRYSTTDFGDYLLDTWAGARTLPFTTAAERRDRAAQAKEGGAA